MEIGDIARVPSDNGGARVNNRVRIGDFNVISVDYDRFQRDLPKHLYRVRVKQRQGRPRNILTAFFVTVILVNWPTNLVVSVPPIMSSGPGPDSDKAIPKICCPLGSALCPVWLLLMSIPNQVLGFNPKPIEPSPKKLVAWKGMSIFVAMVTGIAVIYQ